MNSSNNEEINPNSGSHNTSGFYSETANSYQPLSNSNQTQQTHSTQQFYSNSNANDPQKTDTRWTKESRIMLKNLMSQLPKEDVGSALRVVIEAFGTESSKVVRRGDWIELDLNQVDDDYILDNLYEYCYNIRQSQAIMQQQQQHYAMQQPYSAQPMAAMSPATQWMAAGMEQAGPEQGGG